MATKFTLENIKNFFSKYKYVITFVLFVVFVTFFDENNLIKQVQAKREISHLEKEIKFYQDAIKSDHNKIKAINSSLDNLETFAREEYLMKRQNEEIFIIKE